MSARFWIGTGFAAFLVAFFVIAFFWVKKLNQGQWAILRFLSALCGGAAGAFLTGEAVFKMSGQTAAGLSIAVSGTAGVALFFAVWYGFGKFVDRPPDAIVVGIGRGWTFTQAANAIAKQDNALVQFEGFHPAELNATLEERQLSVTTVTDALRSLGQLSTKKIRPYSVSFVRPTYTLRIDRP